MPLTPGQLRSMVAARAFGGKLIANMYRGLVAEGIVAEALGDEWDWCGQDWANSDFVHKASRIKLEVKQSAITQSWELNSSSKPRSSFSIAAAKGSWIGTKWTPLTGRAAQIYVFAYHDHQDRQLADHLDVEQWKFLVLPESSLPAAKTISIATLNKIATSVQVTWVHVDQLRPMVSRIASSNLNLLPLSP